MYVHFSSKVASFHITRPSSCGSELCGDFSEVNIVHLEAACTRNRHIKQGDSWLQVLFVARFFFISQHQASRKHKQQLWHKRKSKLNGAKIGIQSARCDTAASQGCEGGVGGGAAGELNFPIACYYRTNKLQSGTLCSLPHCPHCSLHPVTLGNATRGCEGGSCARQPRSEITFTRKPVLPVNQTNFLSTA